MTSRPPSRPSALARSPESNSHIQWMRKSQGLCVRCGWHPPIKGRTVCQGCARRLRERIEATYALEVFDAS